LKGAPGHITRNNTLKRMNISSLKILTFAALVFHGLHLKDVSAAILGILSRSKSTSSKKNDTDKKKLTYKNSSIDHQQQYTKNHENGYYPRSNRYTKTYIDRSGYNSGNNNRNRGSNYNSYTGNSGYNPSAYNNLNNGNKNSNQINYNNYKNNAAGNWNSNYNSFNTFSNQNGYNANYNPSTAGSYSSKYNSNTGGYGSNYNSYSSSSISPHAAHYEDDTADNSAQESKNTIPLLTRLQNTFNKFGTTSSSKSGTDSKSSESKKTVYIIVCLVSISALALVFGLIFDCAGTTERKQTRKSSSKSEKKRSSQKKKSNRSSSSKRRKENHHDDTSLEDSFQSDEHYIGQNEKHYCGTREAEERNDYDKNIEYPVDSSRIHLSGTDTIDEYDYEAMR